MCFTIVLLPPHTHTQTLTNSHAHAHPRLFSACCRGDKWLLCCLASGWRSLEGRRSIWEPCDEGQGLGGITDKHRGDLKIESWGLSLHMHHDYWAGDCGEKYWMLLPVFCCSYWHNRLYFGAFFILRIVTCEDAGLVLPINIWLVSCQKKEGSNSMSWLGPSASHQEEVLSVWELPAGMQHLEGDVWQSEKLEKTS